MSWEEDNQTLQRELADLVKHKPPVSRSKVQTITKIAHTHVLHHAGDVADAIERFISKAPVQYRLSGLYLIDSICKKKDGAPGGAYRTQFASRMDSILRNTLEAEKDRDAMKRVISLWGKGEVFPNDHLGKWAFLIKERTGSAPDGITPIPTSDIANSLQNQLAAAQQAPMQTALLAALAAQAQAPQLAALLPGLQNFNLQALLQPTQASAPAPAATQPAETISSFFDYDEDEDDMESRIRKQKQRIEQEQQRRKEEEDRQAKERDERARLAAAHQQQLELMEPMSAIQDSHINALLSSSGRASPPINPFSAPEANPYQQTSGSIPPAQQYSNYQHAPQQSPYPGQQHHAPLSVSYANHQQPQTQGAPHHHRSQAPPYQQAPPGPQLSIVEDVSEPDPNVPAGHKKVLTQTLFVGNLAPSVTDLMLYAVFSPHGSVISMKYHQDKHFAFISFQTRKDAESAKQALHKTYCEGRELKVGWANPYSEGFPFDMATGASIVPLNAVPRFTPNPVSSRFVEKLQRDLTRDPTLAQRVLSAPPAGFQGDDPTSRPKRKFDGNDSSFSKRPKYITTDPFDVMSTQSLQTFDGAPPQHDTASGHYNPAQGRVPYTRRGGDSDRHDGYRENRYSNYNKQQGDSFDDFSVPMGGGN